MGGSCFHDLVRSYRALDLLWQGRRSRAGGILITERRQVFKGLRHRHNRRWFTGVWISAKVLLTGCRHKPGGRMNLEIIVDRIGELFREKGIRLATAESCTGGMVANLITDAPGSSDWFVGGVVSY